MFRQYLILSLALLFVAGCSINEPSLPDWDSKWTIHLRPETVSMSEAINDSVITTAYNETIGDSILFISISDTTDPERINRGDRAFQAENETLTSTVGIVTLDPPDIVATNNTMLEDLFDDLPPAGTVIPPIEPQVVEPARQEVEFERFRTVSIDSGMMWIVFYNNLFIEIDSGLKIVVHDMVDDAVIDTFIFEEAVEPSTFAESEHVNLAGKIITNRMELEYIVPIAGTSEPDTLTQEDLDSHFYSELHISEIRVTSADAIITEQIFIERDSVNVDYEDKILYTADIEEGMVHLDIDNNLQVSANLDITLFNLVDMSGNPKVVTTFLERNSQAQLHVNIGGYRLQHHENPGEEVSKFYYRVKATTVSTDEQSDRYREITSEDSVVVDFAMDSTYVSSFTGIIDPTEIEIEPVTKSDILDTDQIEGSPVLDELVLTLNIFNEINFDIDVTLEVAGYHYDKNFGRITDSVVIPLSRTVERGMTGQPSMTTIVLDKNSSDPSIVDLMAILPTDLKLTGSALVEGEGSASSEDRIWAEYFVESPMTVRLDDPILFESEIDSIGQDDLDQEERDDIDERFSRIVADLNVVNGLPLGTRVRLFIGTDSTTLFNEVISDSSKKIIISEDIAAGTVGDNGFVMEPKEDVFSISLTDRQISVIKNEKIYYATRIEIHPTEAPVSFRKNDRIRAQGVLTVEMRMNPEDE